MTPAQLKMLKAAYYDRAAVGRDSLFDYLKTEHPGKHPPRRAINRWLNTQTLQQTYSQAFTSKQAAPFRPISPWHSLSADLLDFSGRKAKGFTAVLNVLENFSRYQFLVPLRNKEAKTVAKAMAAILDWIQKKYNKKPTFVLVDGGGEFLADFKALLKERGIGWKRTLAASPWQAGLVERNGGRTKRILYMYKRTKPGSWADHIAHATKVANDTTNRSTRYSPKIALELDKAGSVVYIQRRHADCF